jgi:hypothetical protein
VGRGASSVAHELLRARRADHPTTLTMNGCRYASRLAHDNSERGDGGGSGDIAGSGRQPPQVVERGNAIDEVPVTTHKIVEGIAKLLVDPVERGDGGRRCVRGAGEGGLHGHEIRVQRSPRCGEVRPCRRSWLTRGVAWTKGRGHATDKWRQDS